MIAVEAPAYTKAQNAVASAPATTQPSPAATGFSFHDLLDIINPLQHIPIVGTIYRAITGDAIKPFDKIAGDTLYGGVLGFVSAMADTVFQAVTGKDFGDTVLGLLTGEGDSKPTAVAGSATPATASTATTATAAPTSLSSLGVTPVDVTPNGFSPASLTAQALSPFAASSANTTTASIAPESAIAPPGMTALQSALNRSGIDPETARRAAYAYRRAVGLVTQPLTMPAVAAQPVS